MKKLLLLVSLSLLATTQMRAQDHTLTRGIPGIIFGYPSEVPIIDDQSQVATVVWPNLAEVTYMGQYTIQAVDGVTLPSRIRSSPFRRHDAPCFAIDLLPGRHTLSVSYSEYIWLGAQGRKTYNVATPAPVDVTLELEAGCVYQLKAVLSNGSFAGFSLDRELTDPTVVSRLAQSRIINRLAYTPLAGQVAAPRPVQAATQPRTVEPAAPRRTVQPAAPKIVQPATPRYPVQPVAAPVPSTPAAVAPVPAVKAVVATEASAELSPDVALIHIYRVKKMAGAAVGYDIHWGDEIIWRAKNNSKTTIRLTEAGVAALWAKTESRVDLPLDIQLGREYYVRCGMKMGAFVGRPDLEIVDAATGKAEFDAILSAAPQVVIPASAPIEPAAAPAPPASLQPAEPIVAPEVAPTAPPIPEVVDAPVPVGIGNGTLEILSVALPDSVVFRPAPGVEIMQGTLIVSFVSGKTDIRMPYEASGTFRISMTPGNTIFYFINQTTFTAKEFDFPAGFKPEQIVFTVAGKDMTYDIARSAWEGYNAPSSAEPAVSAAPKAVEASAPSSVEPTATPAVPVPAVVPEGSGSLGQGVIWSIESVRMWKTFDGHVPDDKPYEKWASDTAFKRSDNRYTPDQRVADGKFAEILVWFDGKGTERVKTDMIPAGGSALDARLLYGVGESAPVKAFVIPGTGVAANRLMTETWEGNLNFKLEPGERTWLLLLFDVPVNLSAAKLQLKSADPLPVAIP
jgi:hypothetical protein